MATYTQLSVTATPGKPHSFAAKVPPGPHTGLFTALSVMALPGGRHTFTAKGTTGRAYDEDDFYEEPSGMRYQAWMSKLKREDEEIAGLIMSIVQSGMLDN